MSLLTLKHVENCGHESIQLAHSVSFTPQTMKNADRGVTASKLDAFGCTMGGAGGHCCYSSGIVYVMNANGSTVAKYVLG